MLVPLAADGQGEPFGYIVAWAELDLCEQSAIDVTVGPAQVRMATSMGPDSESGTMNGGD